MSETKVRPMRDIVDAVYRSDSRRVFASLVRLLGDFDLAEEALHDAFASAVEQWPRDGVPSNPRAWLVSSGRFKGVDAMRRRARVDALVGEVGERMGRGGGGEGGGEGEGGAAGRVRLIVMCCDPAP